MQEMFELLFDRMVIKTGDDEVQTGDQLGFDKERLLRRVTVQYESYPRSEKGN